MPCWMHLGALVGCLRGCCFDDVFGGCVLHMYCCLYHANSRLSGVLICSSCSVLQLLIALCLMMTRPSAGEGPLREEPEGGGDGGGARAEVLSIWKDQPREENQGLRLCAL